MEEPGRPRSDKQGSRLRNTTTDEADAWRSQESRHGYNPIPVGGQQSRKNQGGGGGAPYRPSPNKGGMGPLSSSPGGFRGGHSPSQKEGIRRFSGPQNSGVRGDGWRGHPKQQQQQQPQQWRKGEHMRDERDYGNREPADGAHNAGKHNQ